LVSCFYHIYKSFALNLVCLGRIAIISVYKASNAIAQNQMGVALMSLASTRRLLGGTRIDLPFHDMYSLTFGIMILMLSYSLAMACYKMVQLAIIAVSQTPGLTVKYVFIWLKTRGVDYTIMVIMM
jgi:hypothetical protein